MDTIYMEACPAYVCPTCGETIPMLMVDAEENQQAINEGKAIYCSDLCERAAERNNAPLVKPQPVGVKIDGYDI